MNTQHKHQILQNITVSTEDSVLGKALIPYHDHCKYLKKLKVNKIENKEAIDALYGEGIFEIENSCYIDDTGHFNAVEYNICFNQLAYSFVGYCVENDLIPELEMFKKDYYQIQLSHFLIANISSSYKAEINARDFQGKIHINSISKRSKGVFLDVHCDFNDHMKGKSTGKALLVMLNPS